jgi:hypothetical protein
VRDAGGVPVKEVFGRVSLGLILDATVYPEIFAQLIKGAAHALPLTRVAARRGLSPLRGARQSSR